MPIAGPGKSIMESSIRSALKQALEEGKKDGADPDQIISNLATDLSNAIDAYVTSCIVTINPGQVVVTALGGAGSTVTPGTS